MLLNSRCRHTGQNTPGVRCRAAASTGRGRPLAGRALCVSIAFCRVCHHPVTARLRFTTIQRSGRNMRKLLGLSLAVAAVVVFVGGASATHSWGNYHWARTANPFTLKLGTNLSGSWVATDGTPLYLKTTSDDWSSSTALNTTIVAGGTSARRCRATAGRVEVCNLAYGNNGWLGIASIWASGDHITQATVKLNDSYFNTTKYNTSAWRNLVMCQEVGHTFGLDHQDENFTNANLNTCMDYTNDPTSNQHPNTHDYDQLVSIYTHTDSSTTVAASTAFLPDAVPSFAQAHRVSESVYRTDYGDGRSLVTHVFWAP